ncbi:MAG: hypothetical protein UIH41_04845, partial [Treponemataceae bacterium]|nr:hypothetical protein [Treponemataceae bacterium]
GSTRPLSIEIGQSKYCRDLHTIKMFKDFDSNTQSSMNEIPQKFYFSITKNENYMGMSDLTKVFMFMRITPKQEKLITLINGKEAILTTELINEDGSVAEATEHTSVYKVKICTHKSDCPFLVDSSEEIPNEI